MLFPQNINTTSRAWTQMSWDATTNMTLQMDEFVYY